MIIVFCVVLLLSYVSADCGVVSKEEWDGIVHVKAQYLPRPVSLIVIAHTATDTCTTDAACEDMVRSIQSYHMDNLKYWDIGFSFLVGGNGKVYEGSGWLRVGAHTYGYNRQSIAVAFIGNFNNDKTVPEALDAVKALIKCGVDSGHLTPDYKLVAHKQLIATESPGRKLYNELRRWPDWTSDTTGITPVTSAVV